MNWKRTLCSAAILLGTTSLVLADPPSQPENFSVTSKTRVPGLTLKPGSYTIRVVDRLSDRIIVRVDAPNGGEHTTFIGLENPDIPKPSTPGLVPWTGSSESYVRGWAFPSIPSVVEFVYPKAEAVKIAGKTDTKVPAIDPESEGRVSDKNLSHDDLELVTLWLLSSTRVGAGGGTPAIQAERYKQPANVAAAQTPAAPATATPVSSTRVDTQASGPQMARVEPPVVGPAPVHHAKPVVKVLPHTASDLPLVWMLGGFSLLGGLALRRFGKVAA